MYFESGIEPRWKPQYQYGKHHSAVLEAGGLKPAVTCNILVLTPEGQEKAGSQSLWGWPQNGMLQSCFSV